jgi:hypothetical protein
LYRLPAHAQFSENQKRDREATVFFRRGQEEPFETQELRRPDKTARDQIMDGFNNRGGRGRGQRLFHKAQGFVEPRSAGQQRGDDERLPWLDPQMISQLRIHFAR